MYRKASLTAAWNTKSLDSYNFLIKTNFKKVKTLFFREFHNLYVSVFTFLKFVFIKKLYEFKLLVIHAAVSEALQYPTFKHVFHMFLGFEWKKACFN